MDGHLARRPETGESTVTASASTTVNRSSAQACAHPDVTGAKKRNRAGGRRCLRRRRGRMGRCDRGKAPAGRPLARVHRVDVDERARSKHRAWARRLHAPRSRSRASAATPRYAPASGDRRFGSTWRGYRARQGHAGDPSRYAAHVWHSDEPAPGLGRRAILAIFHRDWRLLVRQARVAARRCLGHCRTAALGRWVRSRTPLVAVVKGLGPIRHQTVDCCDNRSANQRYGDDA